MLTLILRLDIDVFMTGSLLDSHFESLDLPFFVGQALLDLQALQQETLAQKLQAFAKDMQCLPQAYQQELLHYLRQELPQQSLSTRFLMRLLLDVAEACVERRPLPQYILD